VRALVVEALGLADIVTEIQEGVLPALANAIVAAEVRGDYGPHVKVQHQLGDIARRLRGVQ
jgi:hypothetical protein